MPLRKRMFYRWVLTVLVRRLTLCDPLGETSNTDYPCQWCCTIIQIQFQHELNALNWLTIFLQYINYLQMKKSEKNPKIFFCFTVFVPKIE